MRKTLAFSMLALFGAAAAAQAVEDPYLWLEEINGARAVAQVKKWNQATEDLLNRSPQFEAYRKRALALLDDEAQIAAPEDVIGANVTNLWRDAKNPRGIWRVSPLEAYAAGKPQWRTLIDVDALGKAEGKSWVWHGANCLAPDYQRCLVSLSPGGTDADVVREFDIPSGKFVDGGFVIPEAKSNNSWFDRDHLLVATDYGEGSLTSSGYPRIVKLWTRGTPLSAARIIHTSDASLISVAPYAAVDADRRWSFINVSKTTWTNDVLLVQPDGTTRPVPIPDTASTQDVLDGRLLVTLNEPLGSLPTGAIVAYSLADIAAGKAAQPQLVFSPTAKQAVEDVSASKGVLWVKALDDVSGKLFALTPTASGPWSQTAIGLPSNSTVHLVQTAGDRDLAFATVEGMLTPPTLYAVTATPPGCVPNASQLCAQLLPMPHRARSKAFLLASMRAQWRSNKGLRRRKTGLACPTSSFARRASPGQSRL